MAARVYTLPADLDALTAALGDLLRDHFKFADADVERLLVEFRQMISEREA